MAIIASESLLNKLKRQQQQIQARIKQTEQALKRGQQKADTRRKILIGAHVLSQARKEGTLASLYATLRSSLKRSGDKALFELPTD